ncbi:hypothetical protein FHS85_004329 [Rhodoligotrophos appendicifer]
MPQPGGGSSFRVRDEEVSSVFVQKGSCRHYRDSVLLGMACQKGVAVLEHCQAAGGGIDTLPCKSHGRGCFTCTLYQEPSTQELEEQARFFHEALERAATVRRTLSQADPRPGSSGSLPCPVCGEKLSWSRDGQGEISARCSTDGCVSFPFTEGEPPPMRRQLLTEQRLSRKPTRLTK